MVQAVWEDLAPCTMICNSRKIEVAVVSWINAQAASLELMILLHADARSWPLGLPQQEEGMQGQVADEADREQVKS